VRYIKRNEPLSAYYVHILVIHINMELYIKLCPYSSKLTKTDY